jgi:uncharacterized protein (TIGR02145 family)
MKNFIFTFAKSGRALVLALAVVIGAVSVACGQTRPAALVGQWVRVSGVAAFKANIELFKDGTGIDTDGWGKSSKIFWKVEGKRIVIESRGQITAVDYSLNGSELRLGSGNGSILHVRVDKVEEYAEKKQKELAAAQKKREEEQKIAAEQRKKQEEQKEAAKIENMSDYFTDSRDGQKYRSVKIGGKTWMAQNLNYQTDKSWCYDDDNSNCEKHGRLYDWNTAKKACPNGWHLPSDKEWDGLVSAVGGKDAAGKVLKSERSWTSYEGTDDFGFSALPGGLRRTDGDFYGVGGGGYWWTATESGGNNVYLRYIRAYAVVDGDATKDLGYSVRCVQN